MRSVDGARSEPPLSSGPPPPAFGTFRLEFRPVGDRALMVSVEETVNDATIESVRALMTSINRLGPIGVTELVPALNSMLITFDPLLTDHPSVAAVVTIAAERADLRTGPASRHHVVDVCYDGLFAPDLAVVADLTGMSADSVITHHVSAQLNVAMYGFAPGFAYLHGVPTPIQLPRNPTPGPERAAGSVIIAAEQCLVIPTPLSTGWFAIGRSVVGPLTAEDSTAFRFSVGDSVSFRRITADEFARQTAAMDGT